MLPVAISKPTISLMMLLLPALGLPVKTKYSSSILIIIGKESDLLIPFTHVFHMPFFGRAHFMRMRSIASNTPAETKDT